MIVRISPSLEREQYLVLPERARARRFFVATTGREDHRRAELAWDVHR